MKVTWHEGREAPKVESGLPYEIHFWESNGDILICVDRDRGFLTWEKWLPGVAIKDVGRNG